MPRLLLRPLLRLPLTHPSRTRTRTRTLTTTARQSASSSFLDSSPAPPRLPADQQAEFERLQRAAEAALSTHTSVPNNTNTPPPSPLSTSRRVTTPSSTTPFFNTNTNTTATTQPQATNTTTAAAQPQPQQTISAGSLSAGIRQGAPPEFEGDRNPKTGEVGGPKNEPLRWGGAGDWSYNGRGAGFQGVCVWSWFWSWFWAAWSRSQVWAVLGLLGRKKRRCVITGGWEKDYGTGWRT
ncbi:hypothetical protein N658DRAFT_500879, partial [Parathielavia hyrcaniae]